MKTNRLVTWLAAVPAAFSLSPFSARAADAAVPPAPEARAVVQLALLLDTSNSMDGLIDQARTRLWQVVNDLATARHAGARPRLEVALYEYGNDGLPAEGNYLREVAAFTDDLDDLSAKLFALRTNGGSEFCGAVIERALQRLAWTNRPDDLRLIFIAGNEPFTQGPVDFHGVVRGAVARGITVNTIFCGPEAEGVGTGWKDGAVLADGTFATIDQNRAMPHIDAPQDRELAQLNESLNRTYLPFGAAGQARAEQQRAQDANAAAASPSVAAQRASAKAGGFYLNAAWDLVDAVTTGSTDLAAVKEDELPAEFRGLSADERQEKLAAFAAGRKQIQERIQSLAAAREAFVTAELQRLAAAGGDDTAALDQAIRNSVRAQAQKRNYTFE